MEQIICVTCLIGFIYFIRRAFRKYIGQILTYSLWILVALKLIVPMPVSNMFNVAGLIPETTVTKLTQHVMNSEKNETTQYSVANMREEKASVESEDLMWPAFDQRTVLVVLWCIGTVTVLGCIISSSAVFDRKLRRSREYVEKYKGKITVYQSEMISTPCLWGIIHPTIYIPVNLREVVSEEELEYVYLHEWIHYKHKDHIWSVVRCICVSLYWFHPLVWVACILSKRDSELACDEGVTKCIERDEKKAYGRTLINLYQILGDKKCQYLVVPLTGGNDREMKNRINALAHGTKKRFAVIMTATILAGIAVGVTLGKPVADSNNEIYYPTQVKRQTVMTVKTNGERAMKVSLNRYMMDTKSYLVVWHPSEQPGSNGEMVYHMHSIQSTSFHEESPLWGSDLTESTCPICNCKEHDSCGPNECAVFSAEDLERGLDYCIREYAEHKED